MVDVTSHVDGVVDVIMDALDVCDAGRWPRRALAGRVLSEGALASLRLFDALLQIAPREPVTGAMLGFDYEQAAAKGTAIGVEVTDDRIADVRFMELALMSVIVPGECDD